MASKQSRGDALSCLFLGTLGLWCPASPGQLPNLESVSDEVGLAFPPQGGAGILGCGVPILRQPAALHPRSGFSELHGNDPAGLGALLRVSGPQASALRTLSRFGAGPVPEISLWVPELPGLGLELVLGQ